MKKLFLILTLILIIPSVSYSDPIDKRWSNDDLYLFSAVVSSQIADYSQSIKFNSTITKNVCGILDAPNIYDIGNGKVIKRWYECTDRQYLMGEEKNFLVRRNDGGFDQDRAILLSTILDSSIFYVGTKYPKWRRPLLYLVYAVEILAIQNNHRTGFTADTPVLPVIWTWHF